MTEIKNKIFIIMMLAFFSINLVSAITIYSGESITLELEKPYSYYSIVGNSTEVILDIVQEGNMVTIILDKYSLNDSYEIIFFDTEKETITVYQSSGGGGVSTRTKYVDRNITTYLDKEVIKEVDGETIEIEKIVNKTSGWTWLFGILFIGIIFYIIIRRYIINE